MSERYQVVPLAPDQRGRVSWGIRENKTGRLVEDEGEPVSFGIRDGAEGWVARQNYLNGSVMHRA